MLILAEEEKGANCKQITKLQNIMAKATKITKWRQQRNATSIRNSTNAVHCIATKMSNINSKNNTNKHNGDNNNSNIQIQVIVVVIDFWTDDRPDPSVVWTFSNLCFFYLHHLRLDGEREKSKSKGESPSKQNARNT